MISWFERFADMIPNHVVGTDVDDFPASLREHAATLRGRSMLVRKLDMLPVECVARGYLAGSGWKEYRAQGTVCGIRLPDGLELVPGAEYFVRIDAHLTEAKSLQSEYLLFRFGGGG